ncbi:MAG: HlyD family efflux transporter periplasmic adaptor subunit [Spirochaetales bacterium]|nr:HlyD family efflux transporter periplasmic adaptor subunit [Spirochaetales bacterium]
MMKNFFNGVRIMLIGLLLVLLVGCNKLPFGNKKETQFEAPTDLTVPVEAISIQESVTVSGNIEPIQERELGFSTDGKITAVPVAEGDFVLKGTLLAKIDASSDEYNIEEMEYELEEMSFSESPRKIALKKEKLESLRETLKNKIITAPFDGVVVEIKHEEGEINIASSSDSYLIKIIDDSSLKADVVVDELDIARIEIGQKAVFSFDAIPGEKFTGRVSKIAHIGRLNDNGLPVIDVELIIDKPDPRILIPYSFKVEILTTAASKYLAVPDQSVIWEDDKTYVNINTDDSPTPLRREVKIREWKDGKTIILDGLGEGDRVLLNKEDKPDEGLSIWM